MKSSVTLNVLKNYFKDIKETFSENLDELKYVQIVVVKSIMPNISKWSDTLSKLHVWKRILRVNLIAHNVSKWSNTL